MKIILDLLRYLKEKLKQAGYKMTDITHVILTHLHFDHSGGATIYNSDGDLVPAFPNATYYISNPTLFERYTEVIICNAP